VASTAYLDEVGAATRRLERALAPADARPPFAELLRASLGAIDELQLDVEAGYKVGLR
jgi:hypothetical protein